MVTNLTPTPRTIRSCDAKVVICPVWVNTGPCRASVARIKPLPTASVASTSPLVSSTDLVISLRGPHNSETACVSWSRSTPTTKAMLLSSQNDLLHQQWV